jgi:hypothetical protein
MFVRGMGIGFAFMPARIDRDRGARGRAPARWSACTRSKAPAQAYGTAFWVAAGLTAIAIVPCIILLRPERAAREVKGDSGSPPPDVLAEAVAA